MTIAIIIFVVLAISFVAAWFSLRDYNGDKASKSIRDAHKKQQLRGSIVIGEGKKSKHYSSYSR